MHAMMISLMPRSGEITDLWGLSVSDDEVLGLPGVKLKRLELSQRLNFLIGLLTFPLKP
jgi:hypothetical protein